ncbi:Na+/H+ antiporter subunit E [Actinospongicola halichondriae]|uniref:Na+/H+ antiporter subunit E n=1 Tax=Actinospongicola halichondriae TaxID=3236844 RepID=UPI003D482071
MNRVITVSALTLLWIVLWRDASIANVLSGLVVAVVVSLIPARPASHHKIRPLALARFVVYFAGKLLEANVVLAREVVTPQNSIHTGIIAVPLPGYDDFVLSVVANAVSLTPGTLTLEVTKTPDPVVFVHVLHLRDLDDARREVLAMAERAAAAFPTSPDTAVVTP